MFCVDADVKRIAVCAVVICFYIVLLYVVNSICGKNIINNSNVVRVSV